MPLRRPPAVDRDKAEAIAAEALSFLAGRPEDLGRFLSSAGLGPANLRRAAADPAFLGGVVEFLLSDEKLLVAFAGEAGLPPADVAKVARLLGS